MGEYLPMVTGDTDSERFFALITKHIEPGAGAGRHLDHTSLAGTVRVHSDELADSPAVVVASERMDDNPDWRPLRPGELLHVEHDQQTTTSVILDTPAAHQLSLSDLGAVGAASQTTR